MSEASEFIQNDQAEQMIRDIDHVLRVGMATSGGNQERVNELVNGDPSEARRLLRAYENATQQVAHIKRSFEYHDGLALPADISDTDLFHLAWQSADDAEYRQDYTSRSSKFIRGPVATRLADSLLMAVEMPGIVEAAKDGVWIDLGSGTGMTAIAMALSGRHVVGIEKDPELVRRSEENRQVLERLFGKGLPLEFIAGALPEQKKDQPIPEVKDALDKADVWYSYPWPSELDARVQLFRRSSKKGAHMILYTAEDPATFTVPEIQAKKLKPLELPNGKPWEDLGSMENSWWTVWKK